MANVHDTGESGAYRSEYCLTSDTSEDASDGVALLYRIVFHDTRLGRITFFCFSYVRARYEFWIGVFVLMVRCVAGKQRIAFRTISSAYHAASALSKYPLAGFGRAS